MATRTQLDLVAVIPAGPPTRMDFLLDTIASVEFWTGPRRRIIVMDDSGVGRFAPLAQRSPELVVIPTPRVLGRYWGMYASLSMAYRYAAENYDFPCLLRLDDDALVIGPHPERDAAAYFALHPNVGVAGAYRYHDDGTPRGLWYPRRELKRELSWRQGLRHRRRWGVYRRLVARAQAHGYELGENCLGGAMFLSPAGIRRLLEADMLPLAGLEGTYLEEDHIFALLVKALGMDLGEFAAGGCPMGISLPGLPCAPQELLDRGKKVTHSLRYWADMDQDMIRTFFRDHRQAVADAGGRGAPPGAGAGARS